MPHQRVTAHSPTMPRREIDDLIALRKIVRVGFRMHYSHWRASSGSTILNSRASVEAYAASDG
jgi:hypothetical protein